MRLAVEFIDAAANLLRIHVAIADQKNILNWLETSIMTEHQPTAQDIRELVAFLPRLYGKGAPPPARWPESEEDEDGVLIIYAPEYNETVTAFMETIVNSGCWMASYDPEEATSLLRDEAAVSKAALPEIRRMLTAVVGGERLCDGWWAGVIEGGQVRQLLERLAEIERQGLVDDPR